MSVLSYKRLHMHVYFVLNYIQIGVRSTTTSCLGFVYICMCVSTYIYIFVLKEENYGTLVKNSPRYFQGHMFNLASSTHRKTSKWKPKCVHIINNNSGGIMHILHINVVASRTQNIQSTNIKHHTYVVLKILLSFTYSSTFLSFFVYCVVVFYFRCLTRSSLTFP